MSKITMDGNDWLMRGNMLSSQNAELEICYEHLKPISSSGYMPINIILIVFILRNFHSLIDSIK